VPVNLSSQSSHVTQWLYSVIWLYNRTKVLNKISKSDPISSGYVNTSIACFIVGLALDVYTRVSGNEAMNVLLASAVIYLISAIFIVIWCFKIKRLIEDLPVAGLPMRLSGFMTFLFHVIYLQYKINQLIDTSNYRA